MSDQIPEISIVIPCLNEAQTLRTVLKTLYSTLGKLQVHAEVIVADNGSSDGSPEIALQCGARLVHISERGYGSALIGGISEARGKFVVVGDADGSHDFGEIPPFVEKLRQGSDLVVGSRFPKRGGKIMAGAMPWKHRWIGTPLLGAVGKLFFRSPVSDFNCGFRGIRRDLFQKLDLRARGMEFASEMIVKATLQGAKISEVPVTHHKDGRSRRPHLHPWRDGWRHLRFMLLYSPRWLFLIPGLILFALGAAGALLLMKGPLEIGGLTFGANTLLVNAMAMMIGFQLLIFWLFARAFAVSEGFLPPDPRLEKILRMATLEACLLAGFLLVAAGITLLAVGVWYWKGFYFGPVAKPYSLKAVILAVTSLTLGIEIIFSSFFLSLLSIHRR